MDHTNLNRRDFSRLTLAAAGGLMTGALAGCSDKPAPPAGGGGTGGTGTGGSATGGAAGTTGGTAASGAATDAQLANFLTGEEHACRGLNMCRGQDAEGDNDCAGQGDCATIEHHACGADHDCKGKSGCGATAGINSCEGQGSCGIPMHAGAWEKARAVFEQIAKRDDKEFGDAPPAKE